MDTKKFTEKEQEIMDRYEGAEIDAADDNKVDASMVEADTKELNNNPRNQAIIDN